MLLLKNKELINSSVCYMKSKIFLLAIILLGSILPFVTFATSATDTHTNRINPNIKVGDACCSSIKLSFKEKLLLGLPNLSL